MPIFEAVVVTSAIYSATMVVSHVLTALCCEPRELPRDRPGLAIFLFPDRPMPIDEAAPIVTESPPGDCAICFDPLKGKPIRKTRCGHAFCTECFEAWYKIKPKCPLCNRAYTTGGEVPVPIWMGD